jgi:hypothetical protein
VFYNELLQVLTCDATGQFWLDQLYMTIEALLWHHDYLKKSTGTGGHQWQQDVFYPTQFKYSTLYQQQWGLASEGEDVTVSQPYRDAYELFRKQWEQSLRSYARLSKMYDQVH